MIKQTARDDSGIDKVCKVDFGVRSSAADVHSRDVVYKYRNLISCS